MVVFYWFLLPTSCLVSLQFQLEISFTQKQFPEKSPELVAFSSWLYSMCRWWDVCSTKSKEATMRKKCNFSVLQWWLCVVEILPLSTLSYLQELPDCVPIGKCSRKPPLFDEEVWLKSVVVEMKISLNIQYWHSLLSHFTRKINKQLL